MFSLSLLPGLVILIVLSVHAVTDAVCSTGLPLLPAAPMPAMPDAQDSMSGESIFIQRWGGGDSPPLGQMVKCMAPECDATDTFCYLSCQRHPDFVHLYPHDPQPPGIRPELLINHGEQQLTLYHGQNKTWLMNVMPEQAAYHDKTIKSVYAVYPADDGTSHITQVIESSETDWVLPLHSMGSRVFPDRPLLIYQDEKDDLWIVKNGNDGQKTFPLRQYLACRLFEIFLEKFERWRNTYPHPDFTSGSTSPRQAPQTRSQAMKKREQMKKKANPKTKTDVSSRTGRLSPEPRSSGLASGNGAKKAPEEPENPKSKVKNPAIREGCHYGIPEWLITLYPVEKLTEILAILRAQRNLARSGHDHQYPEGSDIPGECQGEVRKNILWTNVAKSLVENKTWEQLIRPLRNTPKKVLRNTAQWHSMDTSLLAALGSLAIRIQDNKLNSRVTEDLKRNTVTGNLQNKLMYLWVEHVFWKNTRQSPPWEYLLKTGQPPSETVPQQLLPETLFRQSGNTAIETLEVELQSWDYEPSTKMLTMKCKVRTKRPHPDGQPNQQGTTEEAEFYVPTKQSRQ